MQRAQQPKPKDSAPAECSPDLGEVFKNLPYFAVLIDGTPGIPIGFNIYFKTCIYYIDWSTISLWRGIPIVFWVPRCIFCNQCWTRNPNDEKKIAAQSINMHIAPLRLLCSLGLGQTISAKNSAAAWMVIEKRYHPYHHQIFHFLTQPNNKYSVRTITTTGSLKLKATQHNSHNSGNSRNFWYVRAYPRSFFLLHMAVSYYLWLEV